MEGFDVEMQSWATQKVVKFHVDVIHQSEQVERYKLTGGQKEMVFEKRLLAKSQPWWLLSTNFKFDVLNEHTVSDMHRIWVRIDEHMTGKSKITSRPPHEIK